jgi:hypothetical protein
MKKDFNWRIFTSLGLFLVCSLLLVSGAILYLFPVVGSAGVASGFGGLTRRAWLNQHLVFGAIFFLLSGYHLFVVNREPFFSYLKRTMAGGVWRPAELLATVVLTALVAVGTFSATQPVAARREEVRQGSTFHPGIREQDWIADDDHAMPDHHRRHHEAYDRYESRPESRQLAYNREYGDGRGDASVNSGSSYGQAPDDELHRRTTASCSSCH